MSKKTGFVTVAQTSEIASGQVKSVTVDEQAIGLANVDGQFYAFADVCTHDDGPLAEGDLDGRAIICPRHGARFDIRTGEALSRPASVDLAVHEVAIEGDDVLVRVSEDL